MGGSSLLNIEKRKLVGRGRKKENTKIMDRQTDKVSFRVDFQFS